MMNDTARAFMPYPAVPVQHAPSGPLSGLSMGVKDLFDVAGYPTSGGSPFVLAMSGIKTRHAPTVARLLDAGARFAGKTITDEFAFSMVGYNAHFGQPINGAAPDRITGGSSSGSASAVSSRLCDFALGTDTGGSVRCPANHCGLWGIRPTHGRVSLESCQDLAPSLDTCGWFARDLDTFTRVADVLLANDASIFSGGPRLLWPSDLWALVSEPARAVLQPLAQSVSHRLGGLNNVSVVLDSVEAMYWHYRHIQGFEAWMTAGPLISRYHPPMGPGVAERMQWSSTVTDTQVSAARQYRDRFCKHLDELLGENGVMVLPTMPDIAPLRIDSDASQEDYRNRSIRLLCVAGLARLPQLSMPLASRDGAPLGLSLIGPRGSDRALITLASAFQNPVAH
jgi:amidase